jgi:5-methylcytosine-specific restriction endonuclease McrA
MRFTYCLQRRAGRPSAISSQRGSLAPRCGPLTSCNAERADRQPYRLNEGAWLRDAVHLLPATPSGPTVSHIVPTREPGSAMRFTYCLQRRASRPSAISSQRGSLAPRCGPLTSCNAERADRQPYRPNEGAWLRDAVHLLPATPSGPTVSHIVPTREPGSVMRSTYKLQRRASRPSAISSQRGSLAP